MKSVYTTIGSGSAGSDPFAPQGAAESRKAALTIQLDARGERPRKQVIENQMREAMSNLPGVRSKVGLGGSGEKYILTLTGNDANALADGRHRHRARSAHHPAAWAASSRARRWCAPRSASRPTWRERLRWV